MPAQEGGGKLRADAARNRLLILDAARELFAEQGLSAPMDVIAARAGVGIATLYRRFPTREDLVAAAFEVKMRDYLDAVEEGLADPDSRSGFCGYVNRVCAMQASDPGASRRPHEDVPDGDAAGGGSRQGVRRRRRARPAREERGAPREDFVMEDTPLLLMANAGVVQATAEAAPAAWRRFAALMLEAFRAERAHPLPEPPGPRQMVRAMSAVLDQSRRLT